MALLLHLTQKLAHGFHALWMRYPNKSAKQDAVKAYGQVVVTPEIDDQVHEALNWQLPYWAGLDWYHPPYLATYLRKARYLDEPQAPPKPKLTEQQKRMVAQMPYRAPLTAEDIEFRSKVQEQMREVRAVLTKELADEYYRTHPWAKRPTS